MQLSIDMLKVIFKSGQVNVLNTVKPNLFYRTILSSSDEENLNYLRVYVIYPRKILDLFQVKPEQLQ